MRATGGAGEAMITTRRAALAGLGAGALLTACARPERRLGDVIAAGQPAALLIWAVAPERLAGWPRRPGPAALAALPDRARDLPELGALAGGARPADPESLAALRPQLVLDYGDTAAENRAMGLRWSSRLGLEWRLIDGALERIPDAIGEAAVLLGQPAPAEALAGRAADVLERWRAAPPGPAFYYARGADGLETAFRGALATEVLEGAGWTNVAVGARDIGRVDREQAAEWDPEVVVTLDRAFAAAAAASPLWRVRPGGGRRRLLLLPDLPFGWIDRPPSLNRLLGCAWLADPGGRREALGDLERRLYGASLRSPPAPQWIE
jgi:iron complex transport system substrate-binding protein